MKNYWKLEEIDVNELVEDIRNKKVTIPSFQRGVVWTGNKRQLLIDSIKNGYPFGSILIYEDNDGKRQLIDGLQRSMTMYGFINNPAAYFSDSDIDYHVIDRIYELTGITNAKKDIEDKIISIIKYKINHEFPTMKDLQDLQYFKFIKPIIKEYPTLAGKEEEVLNIIEPMLSAYKDKCQFLSNVKIPALIFRGEGSALPLIFERINKEGVKLNKYQIFAASWNHSRKFKISHIKLKEMLNFVANRYDDLGKIEGLNGVIFVDDYNSTNFKNKAELNTFELGYGFGKLLIKLYPELFNQSSKDNNIDSIGFNLINACLGNKNSKMSDLHIALRMMSDSTINEFLIKIIESTDQVNHLLHPFCKFKGNKRNARKYNIPHTELQIVSIIASLFLVKYDIPSNFLQSNALLNFEHTVKDWKEQYKKFKRNIKKYYVLDIINNKWKGTGDKTLDGILLNRNYYFNDYDKESFSIDLKSWYQRDKLNRNERVNIAKPKDLEKLLLNIVYLSEFKAIDHLDQSKYDIEHICPKELMKKKMAKYDGLSLPISSIGNLCLLPEFDNRSKKANTIYEDNSYRAKINLNDVEQKFTFTSENDMAWLNDDLLTSTEFKMAYDNFIDNRFYIIESKIINTLYPENLEK